MAVDNTFLMIEAEKVARELIETGEVILPIRSWGTGDILYVSRSEELIYFTQVFYLKKQAFFLGTKHRDAK